MEVKMNGVEQKWGSQRWPVWRGGLLVGWPLQIGFIVVRLYNHHVLCQFCVPLPSLLDPPFHFVPFRRITSTKP